MSEQFAFYDWEKEKVADFFQVDPEVGLSEQEAGKRSKKAGVNQLSEGERKSHLAIFLDQFKDFMVFVLFVATLISGVLGEYTDAIAIMAILVLNALLGFVQEIKAEKSLQALKKLSAPMARVRRSGKWERIPAVELVPGDIVYLESGDRIPADVRFWQTENFYVEESALTGESMPVEKHSRRLRKTQVPLGDRKNMGYMGTMAVRGTAIGIVVATGMKTEMGKIADLIQTTETAETPLQRRLEQLGKVLIVVALFLTALVVIAGVWHGQDLYKMFLAGVSLAVAAIPEGLPAIVTIALALGVQRMIKRQAIVRKLPSVETLGCATVICSDKTGTLTQNKMTVTHLYCDRQVIQVTGSGHQTEGSFLYQGKEVALSPTVQTCLEIGVLCNNAQLIQVADKSWIRRKTEELIVDGDPTEGALLVLGAKAGLTQEKLQAKWKRIKEYPFDSERKRMSVVLQSPTGKQVLFVKGAPDLLLSRCTHILLHGRVQVLSEPMRREILRQNEALARMALRNLALAFREGSFLRESDPEQKLIFVGLVGMIDPPREEVKGAIRLCKQAGIRTIMITGDHQATAEAIAIQLGIKRPNGLTVNGQDLYNMSESEFQKKVNEIDVYARVSPEHKLRIVRALQQQGHVVAMTGDGVNDAPAIKAADIGIAMGRSGTDVSKEASSLILADDNFATIVSAIEEGRNIYDNIRKFICYLLASNVGEILIMFLAMMGGFPLPLVPIQILWVNLVTDGLPAMALGVDPAEEDTMSRPPRNSKESVFSGGVGWKIVTRGLLIGFCSFAAFLLTFEDAPFHLELAQTVAFATLVMAQLVYVFDCRSSGTIFQRNPLGNLPLCIAVLSSVVLLLAVIYYPPLQPVFHTTPLGHREWILVTVMSMFPVIMAGILDLLRFRRQSTRVSPER